LPPQLGLLPHFWDVSVWPRLLCLVVACLLSEHTRNLKAKRIAFFATLTSTSAPIAEALKKA